MTDKQPAPEPAEKPAGVDKGQADRKAGAKPEVQGRKPQSHGKVQTG